jgi:hypothetical protein
MAKYPATAPRWAGTAYGGDAVAWEAAKRQCRDVLYEWAARGEPGYYSDLAPRVTAIDWPEGAYTHDGQQMGYLLGQVSLEEMDRDEDRPVLSSVVIGKDEGMPSHGYWAFLREDLGISLPRDEPGRVALWLKEFRAACDFYGRRRSA